MNNKQIEKRINAFSKLGQLLSSYLNHQMPNNSPTYNAIEKAILQAEDENPWFTRKFILQAIGNIVLWLDEKKLFHWLSNYDFDSLKPGKIGVITAGNIPLAGFHDMMSVLLSGHLFVGKLSHKDKKLMELMAQLLVLNDPDLKKRIFLHEKNLKSCDAIIATGSNNTNRYFDFYFSHIPHIFRKSRKGIGIISGKEATDQLQLLTNDMLDYFGLGCRNITKLYVPEKYDFSILLNELNKKQEYLLHNKYVNNYEYYKALFALSKENVIKSNVALLVENSSIAPPVACVYFEYYENKSFLLQALENIKNETQCIVSENGWLADSIPFGKTQTPLVNEYADRIDTMLFLTGIKQSR